MTGEPRAHFRYPFVMTEREFALDVVRKLQQAGFQALWAGGCVRDELLGLTPDDYDIATDALAQCGMLRLANRPAETLGLLARKRLELARALATRPSLLLLDEIGGGLTNAEAGELVDTIRELRRRGISIVWIEHIVHVLVQVAERLICMDAGRIIADGTPQRVLSDAGVVAAYLGGVPA